MTAVFWSGAGLLLATTLMGGGEDPPDDAHGPRAASAVSAAPS
ncbi:class F sortase, partial [Streptomyces sp. 13-12-16]